MSGNAFGKIFKIMTFGESHGTAMGCILDGCPPEIEISEEDIQLELDRRKPGQSDVTTQRQEDDAVKILSGVFEGKTLGTPIGMIIYNKDQQSKDYSNIKDVFRPNHADITYQAKYGHRDYRGGGRASAKEQQIENALSAKNGTLIKLHPGDPRYVGEVEYGRLVIDGNDIISRNSDIYKLRHKMMHNGSIYIVLIMDKFFNLLHSPSIMLEGVAEIIGEDDPLENTREFLKDEIRIYKKARGFTKEYIEQTITDSLKRFIRQEYSKRPIIKVEVVINKK